MKRILYLGLIVLLFGCDTEQDEQPKQVYRTFEIRYNNRIDTIVATRCEAANWTSGGWAIKAFDGNDVIATYGLPKKRHQQPYSLREIK